MPNLVRVGGFVLLTLAAAAVFVVLAPKKPATGTTLPTSSQYESLISQALSDDTANALTADSAPKQQVVSGWTARDLLTIIAKEQADLLRSQGAVIETNGTLTTQPFDDRIPALLFIGVLAICWSGVAIPSARQATHPSAVPSSV